MVLPLETRDLHVDDREAERAPVLLGVDHALLDGGDEVPGDRAADDRVDELVAGAALLRLDPQPRDRELAVPAALLLEPALRFRGSVDRLAIGDVHGVGLDLDAELACELLGRDRQVRLSHAAQHCLMGLGVAFDAQDRVLFLKTVQRVRKLVLVALALGADGNREQRFGRREQVDEHHLRTLRREHVAGCSVRELGDGRDVAGRDFVDGVLFLASHGKELVHALVGLRASVREHDVVLDRALQHLEQVYVTDVGVDDRLEDQSTRLPAVERGCGCFFYEEFRQPVDAHELCRTAAQHREHTCRRHARGERARKLGRVDLLVVEVALHEVVVADDDALDERVVYRVLLGLHVVGHRALDPLGRAGRIGDGDVVQQIDHARQARFLADRQLQRRDARAELRLELIERARERRALAVELVHEDRARQTALFGELPRDLRLDLDALDGRHDEQCEVGGLDRGGDVADEVGVARSVEDVHLAVFELEGCQRQRHRDGAALFLGVEVAHGGAVLDPAEADDRPSVEQEGLGQRGLAGAAMPDECDVADLRGRKRLHR